MFLSPSCFTAAATPTPAAPVVVKAAAVGDGGDGGWDVRLDTSLDVSTAGGVAPRLASTPFAVAPPRLPPHHKHHLTGSFRNTTGKSERRKHFVCLKELQVYFTPREIYKSHGFQMKLAPRLHLSPSIQPVTCLHVTGSTIL